MKKSTEILTQQAVNNTIRSLAAYLDRNSRGVEDNKDNIKLMCDISEVVLDDVAEDRINIIEPGQATPAAGGKPYISEANFEMILEASDIAMQECERRNLLGTAVRPAEEAKWTGGAGAVGKSGAGEFNSKNLLDFS